jgi:hypothetical protein
MIPDNLLEKIPPSHRQPLLLEYAKVMRNYREGKWDAAELNGGKICEIVYSIIRGTIDNKYSEKPTKPKNMLQALQDLEKEPSSVPRELKIQIPRMIMALFEIRNQRGAAHMGCNVDPSEMDATVVLAMCKWIMAELIRWFNNVSSEAASAAVSLITERNIPLIWQVGDKKRVLNPSLSYKQKTLLLLYSTSSEVTEDDLLSWIEHSSPSIYRRDVLSKLHAEKLIDFDRKTRIVIISPTGVKEVENKMILETT